MESKSLKVKDVGLVVLSSWTLSHSTKQAILLHVARSIAIFPRNARLVIFIRDVKLTKLLLTPSLRECQCTSSPFTFSFSSFLFPLFAIPSNVDNGRRMLIEDVPGRRTPVRSTSRPDKEKTKTELVSLKKKRKNKAILKEGRKTFDVISTKDMPPSLSFHPLPLPVPTSFPCLEKFAPLMSGQCDLLKLHLFPPFSMPCH